MFEWIAMKDDHPPHRTRVITWVECPKCRSGEAHAHNCLETGFQSSGIGCHFWYGEEHKWNASYGEPNITHWMIPEPPEVKDV